MQNASSLPPTRVLLARGWRRRCPQCGEGRLFNRWASLRENCSSCGLKYLENEGDIFGTIVLLDRVFFLIPMVVVFFLVPMETTWRWIVGGVLLFTLIYTFPHRMGLGLALDYLLRKRTGDLADQPEKP